MQMPVGIKIENVKGKLLTLINKAEHEYELPASIMEGIVSSALAEVRAQVEIELINGFNYMSEQRKEKGEE